MFNEYVVNKTESITALFEAIKRKKLDNETPNPRVRCFAWKEAQPRLSEFLNVYRNLSETGGVAQKFQYLRSASKADDTLHAVNFAFVLARVMLGEPLIEDPQLKRQLSALLGVGGVVLTPDGNPWNGDQG
jgi:hypothetical protein